MFKFILIILVIFHHDVNCAIRKSWKTAANFDSEIPKFTPFENMEVESLKKEAIEDVKEIKTTEASTQPSPSAETIKISSKFKMPEKMAEMFKDEPKEDFGKFAYENSSEEKEKREEKDNDDDDDDDSDDGFEISSDNSTIKVGQVLNVTVDAEDNTVNVNLDQTSLKEIFEGRGKRFGILERVVPLFVLPFLIQSAVVPFIVTTIKLLLMKSLFAGKIAVLFLLLGALRNHQTSMYMKSFATQQAPFLHRDYPIPFLPERRIETHFDGYKVDGKPEAFIN